jgi:hypothetical protein
LVARDMTLQGMIASPKSSRVIAQQGALPTRSPDTVKGAIKLWYYPPQKG